MNQQENNIEISIVVPTFNRLSSLKRLLKSVFEQNFPKEKFEILILNDGSTDETHYYLTTLTTEWNIRAINLQNGGPAVARNIGAREAKGKLIAFVDDDCTIPIDWLQKIFYCFNDEKITALGGPSKNEIPENKFSEVYNRTTLFFLNLFNREKNKARFLTSNNFACRRIVFLKHGGFDERFGVGAEDREFVNRIYDFGEKILYLPDLEINHYHNFTFTSFFIHYYRFGIGSHILFRVIKKEKKLSVEKALLSDYLKLIKSVGKGFPFYVKIQMIIIYFLSQLFFLSGYVGAKWEGVTDLRKEKGQQSTSLLAGKKGTMLGLFSFLGGNIFSSAFGFFSFLIIGKTLSLSEFGIFMVAISVFSSTTSLGNYGLPLSATRYASEYADEKNNIESATILKSGLYLQIVILTFTSILFYILFGLINDRLLTVKVSNSLVKAVTIGVLGSGLYNYLTAAYMVNLEYLKLTRINIVISVTRLGLILSVMIFFKNLENYFWAFIFPFWLGVLITSVHFYKLIFSKGKVYLTNFKKLIKYGSWQTFTGILGQFISQLGTILLALYATSKDIGLFGIATSLSLVFAIIGGNISSYFMPIGSRLKSTDEIKPFITRTFRLVVPIAIICFISLFFSKQIIGLLYGIEKIDAVPIFIILSIPSIISFIFVSLGIILHYFLKPYLFTIEVIIRASVLVIVAYFLGREGVIGIALSYLIAGLSGLVVVSTMVSMEYKKRKLKRI